MSLRLPHLIAIVSTALYLVPVGAHLFELPGKMRLPPAEYMAAQTIYNGWQWFGVVIGVALLATLFLSVRLRANRRALALPLFAFLCLGAALADFLMFTYPVNVATRFWTQPPESFEAARRQWEYSHAAAALLTFAALAAVTVSALGRGSERQNPV